jgi:hypothetical protein
MIGLVAAVVYSNHGGSPTQAALPAATAAHAAAPTVPATKGQGRSASSPIATSGQITRPRTTDWRQRRGSNRPNPAQFDLIDGQLVRWDVCSPINWKLRSDSGIADARTVADKAIQDLADATGAELRYTGEFTGSVGQLKSKQPRTIYVSWESAIEDPELAGDVAGIGGMSTIDDGSGPRPMSAIAVVDSSEGLEPGFADGASEGGVLLHELGHAMGLAHSQDRNRIMFRSTVPGLSAGYQPGDLAVLATAVDMESCSGDSGRGAP